MKRKNMFSRNNCSEAEHLLVHSLKKENTPNQNLTFIQLKIENVADNLRLQRMKRENDKVI